MNTGIGEAMDLSWKLEAMVKGWGGPELLASYEEERRPVALRNVRRASVNFQRMRAIPAEPALLEPGESGIAARGRLGHLVKKALSEEWDSMGIHLGYNYAESRIVVPDGTPEPPDNAVDYEQSSRPGARAPHAWLAENPRSTYSAMASCCSSSTRRPTPRRCCMPPKRAMSRSGWNGSGVPP